LRHRGAAAAAILLVAFSSKENAGKEDSSVILNVLSCDQERTKEVLPPGNFLMP
jgi:hypothetical protein